MTQNFSYWEHSSFFNNYDVIIIGSGIVGLSSALNLIQKSPKLKVCVLEAGFLPSGASTKNAGFACFGSISEAIAELESSSEGEFLSLVEMRWKGLEKLRQNLGDSAIDLQLLGGFEVFRESEFMLADECVSQIPFFNKLLRGVVGKHDIYSEAGHKSGSFGLKSVRQIIQNKYEGQIDTGKMMKALLAKVQGLGVSVFNNCEVISINSEKALKTVLTNQASFKAARIIVATNAFVKRLIPDIDVVPGRGQILVTEVVPGLKLKGAFHYNRGYTYFRNIGGRVLLGGGRNLDFAKEQTYEMDHTALIQDYLESLLHDMILPDRNIKIEHRWSGIMGFGKELMPIVRAVQPQLICAVRCSGMGVAMGSLLGEQAAELVLAD